MIQHALASKNGPLLPILQSDFGISEERGLWLCEFGAIYHNHQRLKTSEVDIKEGDYLRVHASPRRFPVEDIDWKSCVISENEDFVVINKPCGVPTHATVDNLFENAAQQMAKALGVSTFVTHRLDVATSGVLFLAKTKDMQRRFNCAIRDGQVEKTYLAKLAGSFSQVGLIEHFMEQSNYLPKRVSRAPVEGWQQCLLEVLETRPQRDFSEVVIKLITGRTHQIRAQMSDLGHPVLGDQIYTNQPRPWGQIEKIELVAKSLKFDGHYFSLDGSP